MPLRFSIPQPTWIEQIDCMLNCIQNMTHCCIAWVEFILDMLGTIAGPAMRPYPSNRAGSNRSIACSVVPSVARSARIWPTTLANLKPWPEKPIATLTLL